jgi:signal peptidase I
MNDDQSMRDRVAGRQGPGDQAEDGPQPGSSPIPPPEPDSAAPGQASADEVPPDGEPGDGKPGEGKPGEGKRSRPFWRELPVLIVVALVIALVIKSFVVQAFYIPSSSMEDTLLIGD